MDNTLIVALITATGAVTSATIGAVLGRAEIWDRIFSKAQFPSLAGTRWESTWLELPGDKNSEKKEIFDFTRQRRGRVYGYITMETLPDLKWQIEGDYNDRFLRLFWQPSRDAKNKFFFDSGCYFFERRGRGSFEGYAVGYDLETNGIEIAEHRLRQLPS